MVDFLAVILNGNILDFKCVSTEICDLCINLSWLYLGVKIHGHQLVTFSFKGGSRGGDSESIRNSNKY
jgi:hypothetical protein